jgi:transposase InsO family protein
MSNSSNPQCFWSRCFAFEDTDPDFWAKSLLDAKNLNLSAAQKELLRWHYKLSHAALSTIHNLCRMKRSAKPRDESELVAIRDSPILPCTFNVPNACCDGLLCAACTVAKASRRAPSINSKIKPPAREMVLKEVDLQPGDCISCDHFMSPVTGRAIAESGHSSTRHGYTCGTIYIDHASGFMYARCQKSISAEDTIRGKLLFEQEAADSGVRIRKYHSDNGVFSSKQFKDHCKVMKQKLTFSGAGAKFQNGVAENGIKTVCNMARANMLHATMQWPGFSFLDLWPFAIAYAIWVHNHFPPSGAGWSPEELWNKTKCRTSPLSRAHVFGCPVYVLDPKLQDNKPIPKWDSKARQGIFVGNRQITSPTSLSFSIHAHNIFRLSTMSFSTTTLPQSQQGVMSCPAINNMKGCLT